MTLTVSKQRALIVPGPYSQFFDRYAKTMKIEIVAKTSLEYIFDDIVFYKNIDLILYAKETTIEEMYEIKKEYPFRFLFVSPDKDQVLDTKYLPTFTDLCSMLRRLKEYHPNMSWNSIRKLLNASGVKPLPPLKASSFKNKSFEYVVRRICKLGKKEESNKC